MSAHCHHHASAPTGAANPRYRRILWGALIVNAAMFAIEIAAGVQSGSVSLLADAIDFLGDAANYAVSLLVLGMTMGLARWEEFELHCRAAVRGGVAIEAIKETLLQGAIYCGVPAANSLAIQIHGGYGYTRDFPV
eukprot:gene9948-12622_t